MPQLLDDASTATHVPRVEAQRCVHASIINASCKACVDACPLDAIDLTDSESLILADRCDGCGLCAPVCPEQAIEHIHQPLSVQWRDERIALIACEKVADDIAIHSDGKVSCIHAFSLYDLLHLHQAGHRKLLVSTTSCDDCSRGDTQTLDAHLARLDMLLESKDDSDSASALERIDISIDQYLNIAHSARSSEPGKQLSRRGFFRRTANKLNDYNEAASETDSDEHTRITPIGQYLSTIERHSTRLPFVPDIHLQNCIACDTCIRLCPHDALVLDETSDHIAYQINAENCTGCNICIDVCEHDAIEVNSNIIAGNTVVELAKCSCDMCLFNFHTLADKPSRLCPICQQKKTQLPLFQVLD